MMLLDTLEKFDKRRQTFGVADHFEDTVVSADLYTVTTENSGAVTNSDAAGGVIAVTTGATDNNETYLKTTKELFLFAAGKPLHAAARLKFSEASGTGANVAFGLMNAVGADSILDDGAGLKSSYSGVTFFKVDGGTLWNCECSIATTRTGTTLLSAANSLDKVAHTAPGTAYQWLEITVIPFSATEATAVFSIDGVDVKSTVFTYTSATEMQLFVGVKAGNGNAQTVTVDFLGCLQKL